MNRRHLQEPMHNILYKLGLKPGTPPQDPLLYSLSYPFTTKGKLTKTEKIPAGDSSKLLLTHMTINLHFSYFQKTGVSADSQVNIHCGGGVTIDKYIFGDGINSNHLSFS